MIGLLLFMPVGLLLLGAFLLLGVKRSPKSVAAPSGAVTAVGHMINLESLAFTNPKRLLDDAEYQTLRSNPALHGLARRLKKERQELAILWISLLLQDLRTLWRFRRFLIRTGVAAGLREELGIVRGFVTSMVLLTVLKISIHAFGPFVLSRTIRRAGGFVDSMSNSTAAVLGRIPPAVWPEIERNWMQSAA